ncbi:MAG: hypothetical protein ACQEQ4_10960 [Fibrobacterota bacterium]
MSGLYTGVGGRLFFMVGPGVRLDMLGGTEKLIYGATESRFECPQRGLPAEWKMSVINRSMSAGALGGRIKNSMRHKSHIGDDGCITPPPGI